MQAKNHFFYLARCSDGSLYAGTAINLRDRKRTHNEGRGGKYTRTRLPIKIVYSESLASLSEARKREAAVKNWPKEQKEALVKAASTDEAPAPDV
jgi:putative endonuclease